jgi:hypothetical protein
MHCKVDLVMGLGSCGRVEGGGREKKRGREKRRRDKRRRKKRRRKRRSWERRGEKGG